MGKSNFVAHDGLSRMIFIASVAKKWKAFSSSGVISNVSITVPSDAVRETVLCSFSTLLTSVNTSINLFKFSLKLLSIKKINVNFIIHLIYTIIFIPFIMLVTNSLVYSENIIKEMKSKSNLFAIQKGSQIF